MHFLPVAFYSCCTLFILHSCFVAVFTLTHFLYCSILLSVPSFYAKLFIHFSCCFLASLYSSMMHWFYVQLFQGCTFSCWIFFIWLFFYVVIFSYLHVALISCFIFILVAFFHVVLNYVKSVCIRNYSGPHLLAFGLITERYSYLSVFSPNAGQCGPKWLRTWWLFMQWFFMLQSLILSFSILYILYIYMLIKFHLFPVTEKLSLSICIYLI